MEQRREDARNDSDGWVEDALRTDFMAANMLMRLSGSSRPPLKWLRRHPRSGQPQPSNAITHVKELRESAQASPNTPLSLTGSSSPSASDDPTRPAERARFDDSTTQSDNPPAYPAPATTDVRSKMGGSKTAVGLKIRTKRKKTLAELKEQESSLLMDKAELIKEKEALQQTLRDLMLRNERLKKHKLMILELPDLNELPLE